MEVGGNKNGGTAIAGDVCGCCRVWNEEKKSLQFLGFDKHRVSQHMGTGVSRHLGTGRAIVLWVRDTQTKQLEKVHDDRWIMAIIATMTCHTLLIISVHMPQRNNPGTYA